MAISSRKKNLIIANWKTGAYSYNSLAKKHKISAMTVRKICQDIEHETAPAVKALEQFENAKKYIKNVNELKAVENVVKNRQKVHKISTKLLDKMEAHIDKGTKQKVVNVGRGDGVTAPEIVEVEHNADDFKKLSDAIDKASVTLGVNERFSQNQIAIQNNNQNNQQTNIKVEFE